MGITGAMLHIPFHGFMKITLFPLCRFHSRCIREKEHQRDGRHRTFHADHDGRFYCGSLGMCGVPPVAGFISKWFLAIGTVQSGQIVFLALLLIASLLDVVYFYPIIRTAFFEKMPSNEVLKEREAKVALFSKKPEVIETRRPLYFFILIPIVVTASFSILFCLFPDLFHVYSLAQAAIRDLF